VIFPLTLHWYSLVLVRSFYVYLSSLQIPTNNNCLQYLNIERFPTLMYFQKDALPISMMHLQLQNCEKLEFLSSELMPNYSSLVYLTISDNGILSVRHVPILESLYIDNCPNFKFFSILHDNSYQNL